MSPEWFAAANKMLLQEIRNMDIVITTALIPGKAAPRLISTAMVEAMPRGGVVVDLAAASGGNVETTVPGQIVQHGHVTCIGFTNIESRMADTASKAFSGNVKNLLLSMEDKQTKEWQVDLNDPAVRSMCVVKKGQALPPYVPPPPTVAQLQQQEQLKKREEEKKLKSIPKSKDEICAEYWKKAMFVSAGSTAALGAVAMVPNAPMMTTFALSCWVGNSCVKGVAHALHSPLMAMTNAISGMTIVGGMLQLGDGLVPTTIPQTLAAAAVTLSAINLAGGTLVTKKMLDMFRRPTDPPEFNEYFLLPAAAAVVGSGALVTTGIMSATQVAPALALGSALACVGGIASLASQNTARLGISIGAGGIAAGLASTLLYMQPAGMETYLQLAMLATGGGAAGVWVSKRIGPTELPQAVAAFHSLVGLAATATAVGDFMAIPHVVDAATAITHESPVFHNVATYMGAWMGSITATGSAIAYGKLSGALSSAALQLPLRDPINIGLGSVSVASLLAFSASSGDPLLSSLALGAGVLSSGALGLHMTQSIGGADMPVVITLLNSYSGWALCAEGFLLDQPLLTVVGALIGSSGAFLTRVMCEAMNRSLPSVILGGFGTATTKKIVDATAQEVKVHREIDVANTVDLLRNAQKVLIVPGYGLAVAQAESKWCQRF
jgi:H+-translocating NAD(P) transhydrogenase